MTRSIIKMSDIARIAGVSKSTVSRALSDSPLVNKATRRRIQSIAEENGYKINLKARNFRLKETFTVSVLIPMIDDDRHVSDPFFLDMLGSIADAISDRGHEMTLAKVATADPCWLEEIVDSQRNDGLILIGQAGEHERINAVAERYAPIVVWGGQVPDQNYCTVGTDNFLGGQKATQHLISVGRRRIGFLGEKRQPEMRLRYLGYLEALEDAGIGHDPRLEAPAHITGEAAFDAMSELIDRELRVDAVFATSDVVAIGAIRALNERGLDVPEDVAVVGYDDVTLAAYYTPALTTVSQNIARGGRVLVDSLFRILDGEGAAPSILPTELKVRSSTVSPAKKAQPAG